MALSNYLKTIIIRYTLIGDSWASILIGDAPYGIHIEAKQLWNPKGIPLHRLVMGLTVSNGINITSRSCKGRLQLSYVIRDFLYFDQITGNTMEFRSRGLEYGNWVHSPCHRRLLRVKGNLLPTSLTESSSPFSLRLSFSHFYKLNAPCQIWIQGRQVLGTRDQVSVHSSRFREFVEFLGFMGLKIQS